MSSMYVRADGQASNVRPIRVPRAKVSATRERPADSLGCTVAWGQCNVSVQRQVEYAEADQAARLPFPLYLSLAQNTTR